ncbi:quercetin dioxygenase-like cupin family protein [Rhizobium sp. ERR 1071]|uniref:cupin domain-containing protein n=1 Tax=Rhizobium sp. ERR 1071 TaxID=2572677 RepID=UPI001198DA9F|nr:cupin domain-containing protein [Rhizobium sp. ERR1071]TWB09546.1 quercetin dioxygenase-like cupin family protein [Rhizobium sp. ERR1071]
MLKRPVPSFLTSVLWKSPLPPLIVMSVGTATAIASLLAVAVNLGDGVDPDHAHHQMAEMSDPNAVGRPQTTVKPISCEPLPNVPGKSITVAVVDYPPDAYTPRHRHPGSVSAFVLKGTLRSQLDGGPAGTYRAGETWFEPPGTLHLFAENISKTEPAELLATFVADSDCGPLVIPD